MRFETAVTSLLAALTTVSASAQEHHHEASPEATVNESMGEHLMAGKHLVMAPSRPASHADSVRAAEIVATLRETLEQYRDPAMAERDGFLRFLSGVKNQEVYHYTRTSNAVGAAFRFNAAAPTSLLYRPRADGTVELIGAMYTDPARTSDDELDRRVPLGIAHWHRHVNLCIPKRGDERRWLERRDGQLLLGPESSLATEAECTEAKGRFLHAVFGWMMHVNVFREDGKVWGEQ